MSDLNRRNVDGSRGTSGFGSPPAQAGPAGQTSKLELPLAEISRNITV